MVDILVYEVEDGKFGCRTSRVRKNYNSEYNVDFPPDALI